MAHDEVGLIMDAEIQWQEHDLDDIIQYFAKGFQPPKGKEIIRYEFWIDPQKRAVIFSLVVKDKSSGK